MRVGAMSVKPALAGRIPRDQNSRVNALLTTLDATVVVARVVFLASAVIAAAVCVTDWAVRTRRISPFSGVARFFRGSIDPLLAPIERRVVRHGGIPSSAPWWALAAVVVAGIIVIWLLGFVRAQVTAVAFAADSGPRGILRLIVSWAFGLLELALFVRVIASWVRASPWRWWVRWSYTLTEPMLRPLRQFIPPLGGMLDITPIVAYFILVLLSSLALGAL
jgi:YggT family protein